MQEPKLDKLAELRLDNALVVEFLSAIAGALAACGELPAKEADGLRLALGGIAASAEAREVPVLLELERQHVAFLAVLKARYGVCRLSLNLLRYALREPLRRLLQELGDLAVALVKKSELHFNRRLAMAHGQALQSTALVPSVLAELIASLERAATSLTEALTSLDLLHGHAMAGATAEDAAADLAVAEALGFERLEVAGLLGASETHALRRIAASLGELAEAAGRTVTQLTTGADNHEAFGLALGADTLAAECTRLSRLTLPESQLFAAWEIARRNVLTSLGGALAAANLMKRTTPLLLGVETPAAPRARLPESVKRRVAYRLIKGGCAPDKALEAAEALAAYLGRQELHPRAILAGELGRIHPQLTAEGLAAVADLDDDFSTLGDHADEKQRAVERHERVGKLVARLRALCVPFSAMMLSLVVGGCGLKTQPRSDVPELRPDILYRPASSPPPPSQPTPAPSAQEFAPSQHKKDRS